MGATYRGGEREGGEGVRVLPTEEVKGREGRVCRCCLQR